jgi:RHS repeat-associated protein
MGRRIQKLVSTNNGSSYVGEYTNKYAYDGWNCLAILNPSLSLSNSFLWGADLSGSLQGAGGVGGLIKVTYYGTATTNCFVACDGNGNVSALINASNGVTVANYDYGPFGELIRASGPMAKLNPFRFSTKYDDDETDFLYYGYRYYNPNTGRWPSRDPKCEKGGLNLYGFVRNDGVDAIDELGLRPVLPYFNTNATWVSFQHAIDWLNGIYSTFKCCDPVTKLSAYISGSPSGSTVYMKARYVLSPRNGKVEGIQYIWWDCFTAQNEAYYGWPPPLLPYLPSNWREYGWRLGGSTISDTRKGHIAGPVDPFDIGHWNWRVRIVYASCGADGYMHVIWDEAPEREFDWTVTGWIGPFADPE